MAAHISLNDATDSYMQDFASCRRCHAVSRSPGLCTCAEAFGCCTAANVLSRVCSSSKKASTICRKGQHSSAIVRGRMNNSTPRQNWLVLVCHDSEDLLVKAHLDLIKPTEICPFATHCSCGRPTQISAMPRQLLAGVQTRKQSWVTPRSACRTL